MTAEPTDTAPATHEAQLVGTSSCPQDDCDGQATTWWEVPFDGIPDAVEIYRVSCPECGHSETW